MRYSLGFLKFIIVVHDHGADWTWTTTFGGWIQLLRYSLGFLKFIIVVHDHGVDWTWTTTFGGWIQLLRYSLGFLKFFCPKAHIFVKYPILGHVSQGR